MKKKRAYINVWLQARVNEGTYQVTRLGPESLRCIGEHGLHPKCPQGEECQEVLILGNDYSSPFMICAEHWLHICISNQE